MFFFVLEDQSAGRANGCTYEHAANYDQLLRWQAKNPGVPTKKIARADLEAGDYGVDVNRMINVPGSGGGGGLTVEQVEDIAEQEANEAVSGAKLVPPA